MGWNVRSLFSIGLHSRDLALLLQIKSFFGCGIIVKNDAKNEVSYRVNSLQDLTNIIIPHFLKYPLMTVKSSNFLIFKECIEIIKKKEHLTEAGLFKILALKTNLSNGLSDKLRAVFPNIEQPAHLLPGLLGRKETEEIKEIPDPQ